MVTYSDGYGVKGKFGSNTGASSSKSKSYGYKGKKKKAPTKTKNYGFNESVDMSSGGDDDKAAEAAKAASVADLTKYVKDEKAFEKASSVADLTAEVVANNKYEKSVNTPFTVSEVASIANASTTAPTPTQPVFIDTVDMSSGGDSESPYSKTASATPTASGGGGQATDIEELPVEPTKLKTAMKRKVKRRGKRGLRISSNETGLNIPSGSSGLSIPT